MKPLMQQDIDRYKNDIKQNHIQGVVRTYADLLSKGIQLCGLGERSGGSGRHDLEQPAER